MTAPLAPMRFHENPRSCSHANEDVCPTCDFDRYYARTRPDCPWREATCRFCHIALLDQQEIDWKMCAGCYADGIAEQESNR